MVAWDSFVVGESLHHVFRPSLRVVRVYVEVSGPRSVFWRGIVVGCGSRVCPPLLYFSEIILGFRESAEAVGQSHVHLSEDFLESVEDLLASRVEIRLVPP